MYLRKLNDFFTSRGKDPVFTIQLVGASPTVQLNNGLFIIQTDATIHDVERADIIIIPALYVDVEKYLAQNAGPLYNG